MRSGEAGARIQKSGVGVRRCLGRRLATLAALALATLAGCAWSGRGVAADRDGDSLEAMVRGLEARYRSVRTLRAAFTQTYQWGGQPRVESGTAYFARGGMMRWDYHQPQSKLVVSDGKKLWLYIPEEKQVTISSMKTNEDARVPFPLLVSHFDLHRIFSKVEFADQALKAEPGDRVLRGDPKKAYEDEYSEVLMEVTPSLDIRRLVVFYPDNAVMEFKFADIERNPALSAGLFTFHPPAGTEVIDQ